MVNHTIAHASGRRLLQLFQRGKDARMLYRMVSTQLNLNTDTSDPPRLISCTSSLLSGCSWHVTAGGKETTWAFVPFQRQPENRHKAMGKSLRWLPQPVPGVFYIPRTEFLNETGKIQTPRRANDTWIMEYLKLYFRAGAGNMSDWCCWMEMMARHCQDNLNRRRVRTGT